MAADRVTIWAQDDLREGEMTWQLNGTYFESCNCEMLCPCTWSAFAAAATYDRCKVVLVYHVDDGQVDDVDVSSLTFALVVDAPQHMGEGGWRVGVCLDANASDEQADRLGQVVSGQLGGPPAALTPLLGEMLGVEKVAIDYSSDGGRHSARLGSLATMETEDLHVANLPEPVQLHNVFHPSNTTLTVSPAKAVTVDAFGISYEGDSGFSAPFSWSG
jgi:hypothetical protein